MVLRREICGSPSTLAGLRLRLKLLSESALPLRGSCIDGGIGAFVSVGDAAAVDLVPAEVAGLTGGMCFFCSAPRESCEGAYFEDSKPFFGPRRVIGIVCGPSSLKDLSCWGRIDFFKIGCLCSGDAVI